MKTLFHVSYAKFYDNFNFDSLGWEYSIDVSMSKRTPQSS